MTADRAKGPETKTFSLAIVVGIVVVGIVSFAAFIVLSAFADDLRQPDDGGPHAMSKSAVGFAGLVSLLEGDGRHVRLSRGLLNETESRGHIAVLTPDTGQEISADIFRGHWGAALIVLPKWATRPDFDHPGWVHSEGLARASSIERVLRKLAPSVAVNQASGAGELVLQRNGIGFGFDAGSIDRLQTIVSTNIAPLLTDEGGHIVLGFIKAPNTQTFQPYDVESPAPATDRDAVADGAQDNDAQDNGAADDGLDNNPSEIIPPAPVEVGDGQYTPTGFDGHGPIYILADPDLLNTKGLASPVTAKAALQALGWISPGRAPVVFDMTLHGLNRSRNFLKLMFEPPFLPAVLCLAFSAGLIAVSAFAGGLRTKAGREIALGKTMLVENSALLVSLAGRDGAMGRRYVAMTRALAANAAGVPPRSTEAQQIAMLDAASRAMGKDKRSFSALAAETTAATNNAVLLRAVNALYRWRQEIGREHRRR